MECHQTQLSVVQGYYSHHNIQVSVQGQILQVSSQDNESNLPLVYELWFL